MHIVASLFIESIDMRQAPGPSTRLDLSGVHFSMAAPEAFPVTVSPHLVVLIYCPPHTNGFGALEVSFERDGDQLVRNVSPVQVEPGMFTRQLVQAKLDFDEPGTVVARCILDGAPSIDVPFTLLPPV